jgi:hypothetical protein
MKRALNGLPTGEPEISPEADAAMRELKELFSDPKIQSTASLRCCTEGPTELDVFFESRRLYQLGFIPRLPREWK